MNRMLAVVALVLASTGSGQTRPFSHWLCIHDVTLIDATGAPAQAHRSVIVRDHRIVGIVASGRTREEFRKARGHLDRRPGKTS
jgi:hypothetical protein